MLPSALSSSSPPSFALLPLAFPLPNLLPAIISSSCPSPPLAQLTQRPLLSQRGSGRGTLLSQRGGPCIADSVSAASGLFLFPDAAARASIVGGSRPFSAWAICRAFADQFQPHMLLAGPRGLARPRRARTRCAGASRRGVGERAGGARRGGDAAPAFAPFSSLAPRRLARLANGRARRSAGPRPPPKRRFSRGPSGPLQWGCGALRSGVPRPLARVPRPKQIANLLRPGRYLI